MASLALALTVGVSCNKDKTNPNDPDENGGKPTQPLIATADINYVTDGKTFDFICYREKSFGEIINYGDTLLTLRFRSTNKYGDEVDGPDLMIYVQNENGFHQGDVYTFTNDHLTSSSVFGEDDYIAYKTLGSAEVKITSISGNNIKGTFEFTAYTILSKEVIVTNGKFDSNY